MISVLQAAVRENCRRGGSVQILRVLRSCSTTANRPALRPALRPDTSNVKLTPRPSAQIQQLDDPAVAILPDVDPASSEPEEVCFADLGLDERLVATLHRKGLVLPTTCQATAVPLGCNGESLLCQSHTGTGKTLAFGLPLVHQLAQTDAAGRVGRGMTSQPAALVLVPTRELCMQVEKELRPLMNAVERRVCSVFGGSPYRAQEQAFANGVDLVIATPGRLLDHLDRGNLSLNGCNFVVLDEADQMLEIGFERELETILGFLPKPADDAASTRQTFLFSATMPRWVKQSSDKLFATSPVQLDLVKASAGGNKTAETVHHIAVVCPSESYRASALIPLIQSYGSGRALVFTDTKADADKLGRELSDTVSCGVLHGDVTQQGRERAMDAFRKGTISCLVATDVAARGIDVPEVPLVVQYRPPKSTATYIHRSGRTGRAGKNGVCAMLYGTKDESHFPDRLSREAGFKFEFVGDLTNIFLKAATLDTVSKSVNRELRSLRQSSDTCAVQQKFIPIVQQLCEQHNKTADVILASVLARLNGFGDHARLPSLLPGGARDWCTLQLTIDRQHKAQNQTPHAAMVRLLFEQMGNDKIQFNDSCGKIVESKDGSIYFDMPQNASDKMIEYYAEDPQVALQPAVQPPKLAGRGRGGGFGGGQQRGGNRRGGGYQGGGSYQGGGRGRGRDTGRGGGGNPRGGRDSYDRSNRGSGGGGRDSYVPSSRGGRDPYDSGSRGRGDSYDSAREQFGSRMNARQGRSY